MGAFLSYSLDDKQLIDFIEFFTIATTFSKYHKHIRSTFTPSHTCNIPAQSAWLVFSSKCPPLSRQFVIDRTFAYYAIVNYILCFIYQLYISASPCSFLKIFYQQNREDEKFFSISRKITLDYTNQVFKNLIVLWYCTDAIVKKILHFILFRS